MYNTLIYNLFCFLGDHLPLPVLYIIARIIAYLRYIIFFRLRKTVKGNIRIILEYKKKTEGISYTERQLNRLVKRTFYNFGQYMADFFYAPRWDLKRVKKMVRIEGIELLDEGISYGRGVIGLTAHIGNWELAGIVASILGYKVTAVAIPYLNPSVTRIYKTIRNAKGLEVILTGSNPKSILKTLKENRILALLGDRIFTEKGARVKFLGIERTMPRGPASLAARTGAYFTAAFFVMEGKNYRFFFKRISQPPDELSKEEKTNFLFQKGADVIEKVILNYPDQWLNFSPWQNIPRNDK